MFEQKLLSGKIGESQIAKWLRGRGFTILPVYEIELSRGKGPAVYTADGTEVIAPDMLVFNKQKIIWVEAKHKNAFTWHRATNRFVTGIDIKHYKEYKRIAGLVEWPVWLLFLHKGGIAKDSPRSPSGLYGREMQKLIGLENHTSDKWGSSGMVYWAIDNLFKLAEYDELVVCDTKQY